MDVYGEFAFAEMVGLLAGLDEARAICGDWLEAILNDGEGGRLKFTQARDGVFEAENFVFQEQALVALLVDESEGFIEREFFGNREIEGDEKLL